MWCEDDQVHRSTRLPESGFWISNFGYIVYIQDYRTVQRAHCTLVCSSFPRGLPWLRVLPSWIASYLLPPASCLLDCLDFASCPPAVSYKPGSTVNRHSYKSLFLFTFFKSENENANKGDECWNFHQQNWFVVYRGFHVFLSFERLQSLLCVVVDCYFAWKLSSVFVRQLWQNTKFIIMKSGQFAINYWFNISFCFIFLDMWTNPCQRGIAGYVWVWRHR